MELLGLIIISLFSTICTVYIVRIGHALLENNGDDTDLL